MRRVVITLLGLIWLGMLLVVWRQWSSINNALTPPVQPAAEAPVESAIPQSGTHNGTQTEPPYNAPNDLQNIGPQHAPGNTPRDPHADLTEPGFDSDDLQNDMTDEVGADIDRAFSSDDPDAPFPAPRGGMLEMLDMMHPDAADQKIAGDVLNLPPCPGSTRLSSVRRDVGGVSDEMSVYQLDQGDVDAVVAHYLPHIKQAGFTPLPVNTGGSDAQVHSQTFVRTPSEQTPSAPLRTLVLRITPSPQGGVRVLLWMR